MKQEKYLAIAKHYEDCFKKHGATPKGVDWPNLKDALKRHQVMLAPASMHESFTILDFGCGYGHLLDTLNSQFNDRKWLYTGMDISSEFIGFCQSQHPEHQFICQDILTSPAKVKADHVIANGVFTEKRELDWDNMWHFFTSTIKALWQMTDKTLSFNLMSKNVDWERDDLFHVSLDQLTEFLCKHLSRNFVIDNNYGLYEYTVHVYKQNN